MRFNLKFVVNKLYMPSDYRNMFFNFFKNGICEYDKEFCKEYEEKFEQNNSPCTYSVHINHPEKIGNKIEMWSEIVILNFSTVSREIGIKFFNAMNRQKYKEFSFDKNNAIKLLNIDIVKERNFETNEAVFKTISPVIIKSVNAAEDFFGFEYKNYCEILKEDLSEKIILNYEFPKEYIERDVENLKIDVLKYTKVEIDNYLKKIIANEAILKINARKYILDYIYKSGLGKYTNQGFGMLDII